LQDADANNKAAQTSDVETHAVTFEDEKKNQYSSLFRHI